MSVTNDNNRKKGTRYEVLSKTYLQQKGYQILTMNYRCKLGEIDIIARDNQYIVFVEVKYRKRLTHGYPRESVNYFKKIRLVNAAKYYLMQNNSYDTCCRFDIIEILEDNINHIVNVFD